MIEQKSPILPQVLRQIGGIVLLAIAYYGMAEISRHLASTPQDVTPVWPPDGIAAGAVLLFGNWMGYGVFLGSFFANFWAFGDLTSFFSLAISTLPVFGIAIGTTLGTLLGGFLLRKTTKVRYPLERVSDVFKFLFLTGMVGPNINASVGVACLALSGKVPWTAYWTVWLTWWISNVSGIVIVTPILLSWGQFIQKNRHGIWQWLSLNSTSGDSENVSYIRYLAANLRSLRFWLIVVEAVILMGLVIFISKIAFGEGYHLEYMLIPMLIWCAFRFGQPGATVLTFIVAAIAAIATVNGKGGFASEDLNQSFIQLQSFIGVITLTILVLTATIAERSQAQNKLRLAFAELARTNETLEVRVQERTEELNEKNITLKQTLQTLKQTQLQMLQSEKMSALGQMVAGVAHEINNPVNFIHGNLIYVSEYTQDLLAALQVYQQHYPNPPQALHTELEKLELDFLREDLTKILQSMKSGTERIRTIVLSLRNFSRLDESEWKEVDVHQGIDSTLVILQHRLQATSDRPQIQVIKEYGELPPIECDASSLNQVFMNLLSNAVDALEESNQGRSFQEMSINLNTIHIQTRQLDTNQVTIVISDNGIGIPQEICSKLFDPFFTTKPVGKGTGLGLFISYQIVTQKHGGNLWCESTVGQGTKFAIEIPVKAKRMF
ncbi:MAG: MASE1 domain-containing protein [Nostoc sp. ChiSLP02]|nr:MASE1 domain-containing protein [Nostoc sp. DedSLP05]MDZ8097047.1 MASE1 domain-containing protein [Nostoc sp. DedSLP01]MDZ8189868.1 MASE1 domain-containing protein [Nostoc sp. ChiSLP02]